MKIRDKRKMFICSMEWMGLLSDKVVSCVMCTAIFAHCGKLIVFTH